VPASTDDCSDVGGSTVGCGVGSSATAAKSRAAVPGWGPMKPSLTPVMLASSWGGRVEWGAESDPLPVPREVPSATLLRAVRAFALNLSMSNGGRVGGFGRQGSSRNILWAEAWTLKAERGVVNSGVALEQPIGAAWAMTAEANALTKKMQRALSLRVPNCAGTAAVECLGSSQNPCKQKEVRPQVRLRV
jgi:hypothetical protein